MTLRVNCGFKRGLASYSQGLAVFAIYAGVPVRDGWLF
jgi:hypothetical protein